MEIDIGFSDKIKFGLRYANYKMSQSKLTTKDKTVIQTAYGPVQGVKRTSPYGEQYHSFEGIPFGKPPIGRLRFKGPEEPEPWTEVLDCSEVKTKPCQHNLVLRIYEGSEDCLYVNVYSRNLKPDKPLPVLVWIYGGGFQVGEASRDLYAPDYLMKKEVVLISINYRLGSLGFLSFDDPETKVSGNAALKDQVLALKWVKKNCEFFGGDSNNITVFGESAGGASTHYMMLTEQTRDLFHKGIIMSASAMAQWAVTPRRNWGFRMAQLLGYQGPNNDLDVLYFLQLQKPYDIMKAGEKLLTVEERKSRIPFAFGPVIEPFIMEDSVITKAPLEMMREAWSNKIPMMIGGVSFEGLLLSVEVKKYPFLLTDLDCRDLVPADLKLNKESEKSKEIANKIQKYYFGDQKPSKENKKKYLELFSDKYWWQPIHRTIMSRSTNACAPTFVYRFDFDSKTFNIFRRLTCGRKARGVCHADDIAYLFYNAIAKKLKETKREYKTIENMVTIWTNFATFGDPNSSDAQFNWAPSAVAHQTENKCLNINDDLSFDISIRLKSVKNIQKITKSMKMVAAAKYAKAERELKGARAYGVGARTFFDNIDPVVEGETKEHKNKRLYVLITSDRGLCGAVHTSIVKEARNLLREAGDADVKIACIGDKARGGLQRVYAKNFILTGNEIGRAPPTFADASIAAKAILDSGFEFEEGAIIFNKFKSVVSYETSKLPILPLEAIKTKEALSTYDSVDDDVLQSYAEYSLAQLIYYAMKESATSEQSSRMTAMDGASKNAGEMIDKLTLAFNRTRQAVITRELIEIISGAACV